MQDMNKLDQTVNNYYNKMKALSDTLTSIGQPLRPDEFTSFVLSGLDADYDNLVEMAQWHGSAIPSHDLLSRMLSTEQRIEARRSSESIHSANAARYGKPAPRPIAPSVQSWPNNGPSFSNPRPNQRPSSSGGSTRTSDFGRSDSSRGPGSGARHIYQLLDDPLRHWRNRQKQDNIEATIFIYICSLLRFIDLRKWEALT
jgi:hypothetical protein